MKCLCCGKNIASPSSHEAEYQWHKKCIKSFFGTDTMPEIDISESAVKAIAIESINRGFTVPGVQKKLSLHLSHYEKKPRLTMVNYPSGYILKPQTEEYEHLPEAEYLIMNMAKISGIKTVPFALLYVNDTFSYITKRIDRPGLKDRMKMLAMEDFCQLDGRLTEDKYKGSYERCGKIIDRYSARSGLDKTELFLRVVFSYIVGNSDMHLKNFSLIETEEKSQQYVLSEAYDMLPVNIILPSDREQMALTLNGKKRNIRRKDMLIFAETIGINTAVAGRLIDSVLKYKDRFIKMCKESLLPENMKEALIELIENRVSMIL